MVGAMKAPSATITENGNLLLSNVQFSTSSYKAKEGMDFTVKSKTGYVNVTPQMEDTIAKFGIKRVYDNSRSKKENEPLQKFLIMNFAGKVLAYDTKTMTKAEIDFTNPNLPNFKASDYAVVVIKFTNKMGQESFRIKAFKGNPDVLDKFEAQYFGDDDLFHEIAEPKKDDAIDEPKEDLPF